MRYRIRILCKQKGDFIMMLILGVLAVIAILVAITLYDHFKSK
jgi:hypothetical protein